VLCQIDAKINIKQGFLYTILRTITHNLVSTFGQADDKAEQAPVLPDQQAEAPKAVPAEESEEEIDGPSEIIWEGNQITVRKKKVKKSVVEAVAEVSYWTCLAWPSFPVDLNVCDYVF
jgi:hypothetical protein